MPKAWTAGRASRRCKKKEWRGWRGSNPRPLASEANTLSTELQPHVCCAKLEIIARRRCSLENSAHPPLSPVRRAIMRGWAVYHRFNGPDRKHERQCLPRPAQPCLHHDSAGHRPAARDIRARLCDVSQQGPDDLFKNAKRPEDRQRARGGWRLGFPGCDWA